ncbi:MAG: hypothetical protein J6I45_06005 [Clostridia bacterium]|nr:hypothetical protein [Clostridia bacterium]
MFSDLHNEPKRGMLRLCPRCGAKSFIAEDAECPICGRSLTYEPPCEGECESVKIGKYFALYLVKITWWMLLSLTVAVISLIIAKPAVPVVFLVLGTMIPALFMGIFERYLNRRKEKSFYALYQYRRAMTVLNFAGLLCSLIAHAF